MSKNTQTKDSSIDSVDQIRNILFGEQVKIFENKFAQLEDKLTNSIEQLSNRVDAAIQNLDTQIEASSNQSQSDNTGLAKQHAKDLQIIESTLNNKITETESELLNQIQSGLDKLDSKASHRNELAQLLKDMAGKLAD